MLKDIARNAKLDTTNEEAGIFTGEITLSPAQKKTSDKILQLGGSVAEADLDKMGIDRRSLRALEDRKVVSRKSEAGSVTLHLIEQPKANDETNVLMTGEELKKALDAIFGYGGQTHFARIIGVNKFTVGKWTQGILEVPQYAVALIKTFEHLKACEVSLPDFARR
jgi:DNA-binding transcriptional regulator YiaG